MSSDERRTQSCTFASFHTQKHQKFVPKSTKPDTSMHSSSFNITLPRLSQKRVVTPKLSQKRVMTPKIFGEKPDRCHTVSYAPGYKKPQLYSKSDRTERVYSGMKDLIPFTLPVKPKPKIEKDGKVHLSIFSSKDRKSKVIPKITKDIAEWLPESSSYFVHPITHVPTKEPVPTAKIPAEKTYKASFKEFEMANGQSVSGVICKLVDRDIPELMELRLPKSAVNEDDYEVFISIYENNQRYYRRIIFSKQSESIKHQAIQDLKTLELWFSNVHLIGKPRKPNTISEYCDPMLMTYITGH